MVVGFGLMLKTLIAFLLLMGWYFQITVPLHHAIGVLNDALYEKQIGHSVTWTTPFTQGFNNYDISYTSNTKVTNLDDGISGLDNKVFNSDNWSLIGDYVVFMFLVLIIGIVGCVFLYFKRKCKVDE
jgi:hypothetical protein